jgi:hypothetical protein
MGIDFVLLTAKKRKTERFQHIIEIKKNIELTEIYFLVPLYKLASINMGPFTLGTFITFLASQFINHSTRAKHCHNLLLQYPNQPMLLTNPPT